MSELSPHYDRIADAYAAARRHYANRRYLAFQHEVMLQQVTDDLRQMRVLDCMSGSCEFAYVARERVGSLHAVDISTGILQQATPPLPTTRTCASALQLPFAPGTFDAVFISGGLHHIRADYETALEELHRVLKPGGWLVAAEPADDNPLIFAARSLLHIVNDLYEEGEAGFRREELEAGFRRNGFTNVSTHRHGYVAYTLIGNTDVFPLFTNLQSEAAIDALLKLDRLSPQVPLWRSMALAHITSGRCVK
ncbi:MAG: class I SAM-dependent methyltransferase [Chloroflexota bacterium]